MKSLMVLWRSAVAADVDVERTVLSRHASAVLGALPS